MKHIPTARTWMRYATCMAWTWLGFTGAGLAQSEAPAPIPIDIQAERLEYRDNNKTLLATGNVVITQGETILRADSMEMDTETYKVFGQGNVRIRHKGDFYEGNEFHYDMRTKEGDFESFKVSSPPFLITSQEGERLDDTHFLLRNATITTCEGDRPELYIRAKETLVNREKDARSKHVFVYLGGIPIFYLPYYRQNITGDGTNIDVVPGYSDRMGFFLLTAYNYRFNSWLEGATHLDYRYKRGIGFGQDFIWRDLESETFDGGFRAYYTNDKEPFRNAADEAANKDLVDEERYRVQLRHRQNLSADDTLRMRAEYLSDPKIIEDFFDTEFRYNRQPENFVTLSHRDEKYTADLTVNKRLNDFYNNVDRLPEFILDMPRRQISDSSFYVSSRNSAAYLDQVFAEQIGFDDVGTGRIDTDNTLYHYSKHFGWLNVVPRMGVALTYYSQTVDRQAVTETGATTNALGEVSVSESTSAVDFKGGSDVRGVFELGVESSFKAFKVLDNMPRGLDSGRRHVIEPFADYTFIPEPNVVPEDLFPYDQIDARDEANDLQLGLRNKLQTKREGVRVDLLDVSVGTIANVSKADDETETFEDVFFDMEMRWWPGTWVDLRGDYDLALDEWEILTAQLAFESSNRSRLGLDYIFRERNRNQITGTVDLFPMARWSYAGRLRYDFDEGTLQEQSHFITHTTDCIGVGLGVREVDEDWTVWAQLWLVAMPRSIVELGR